MAQRAGSKRHCLFNLTLPLLFVGALLASIAWPLLELNAGYNKTAVDTANRIVRYERLLGQRERLEKQLAQLRSGQKKGGYFLESANAELAAAQLQARVKDAIAAAGGTLVSTQNVAPVANDESGEIRIKVRMNGDAANLADLLHDLESSHPLLFLRDMSIRSRKTVQGRRENRVTTYSLDVNFDLVGYMLQVAP